MLGRGRNRRADRRATGGRASTRPAVATGGLFAVGDDPGYARWLGLRFSERTVDEYARWARRYERTSGADPARWVGALRPSCRVVALAALRARAAYLQTRGVDLPLPALPLRRARVYKTRPLGPDAVAALRRASRAMPDETRLAFALLLRHGLLVRRELLALRPCDVYEDAATGRVRALRLECRAGGATRRVELDPGDARVLRALMCRCRRRDERIFRLTYERLHDELTRVVPGAQLRQLRQSAAAAWVERGASVADVRARLGLSEHAGRSSFDALTRVASH